MWITPTAYSTSVDCRSKPPTKNHITINCQYYRGIEKIYISKKIPLCSKDELRKEMDLYKESVTDNNKITDLFEIEESQITDDIKKKFRLVTKPIEYPYQEVPIDPYIFGLWLGDGTSRCSSLTSIDEILINRWCDYARSIGLDIRESNRKERKTVVKSGELGYTSVYVMTGRGHIQNTMLQSLREMDVLQNKHIPNVYIENSIEVRLQVLAGIIDTDGSLSKARYEITQKNTDLSKGIVRLCESLGFDTQMKITMKICTNSKNKIPKPYNRIYINISQHTPIVPVLLERKKFTGTKFYFNKRIEGSIKYNRMVWTSEAVNALKVEAAKYPGMVQWKRITDTVPIFNNINPDGLRAKWREIKQQQ